MAVRDIKLWTCLSKNISDYIPQNLPTDLNSSIHVTSDFFLLERGWRGGDFLMAEASRAYPAWNVMVFFYLAQQLIKLYNSWFNGKTVN